MVDGDVAVVQADGDVAWFDGPSLDLIERVPTRLGSASAGAVAPNGSRVAVASGNGLAIVERGGGGPLRTSLPRQRTGR